MRFKVRVQQGAPYRCWIHMKVGKPNGNSQRTFSTTSTALTRWTPRAERWCSVPHVRFRTSGEITVRVQAGMEGVGFDQFLLGPTRFLNGPPAEVVAKPAR